MFSKSRPASKFSRKRRSDIPTSAPVSDQLVFEDPQFSQSSANVVDEAKVKQYIQKLQVAEDQNVSSCIKVVVCNSEAAYFTSSVQEDLVKDFGIGSFSVSDKAPLNVDRIVTIYGDLQQVLRCVLYMAFLLNSNINNYVKAEPFTLKSQNYHVDVLVETSSLEMNKLATRFPAQAIDYSVYNLNRNLHLATLRGDFTSLFNSLVYIYLRFSYDEYSAQSSIKLLLVIGVHDGGDTGDLETKKQEKAETNNKVLQFIYSQSFLQPTTK